MARRFLAEPLVTIDDTLFQRSAADTLAVGEIYNLDALITQVIIFLVPVVADDENIEVQLRHLVGMDERRLGDDDIRPLDGSDQFDPLLERDDRVAFMLSDQLI